MEWLNLHISVLRSPEYIGSDPRERATWLNVLAYCAQVENGGRISDSANWKDRQWQQACGVTRREVMATTKLLTWEGDTLHVRFYPREKELEVKSKRESGRKGGQRSGEARAQQPSSTASSKTEPQLQANQQAVLQRKGMEGKEKGMEARAGAPASPLPASLSTPAMLDLWPRWLEHWAAAFHRGKPMPLETEHAQLRALVAIGPERATAAINNAITRGLREPAEPHTGKTATGGPVPWQRQSGEALKPGESF